MFIPRKIPVELIPALMAGAVGQVVQAQPIMQEDYIDDVELEFCMAAVQRLHCFTKEHRAVLPDWFMTHLGTAADLDDDSNSGFCSGYPFELCIPWCSDGAVCKGEDVNARWAATGWTFEEVRWIACGY